MCVGSDEPFSSTTPLQRWKCPAHSRSNNEGICWLLSGTRRCIVSTPSCLVRVLTERLAVHNIYCRPPEATALFLHDGKGFYDTNIRPHTTSPTKSSQPNMATSEIQTESRVSRIKFSVCWQVSMFIRSTRVERVPGSMLLRRRAMALGCVRSFWLGEDLGDTRLQ